MTKQAHDMPKIGSFWIDSDEGCDKLYQYRGIEKKGIFKGRMVFKYYDSKTKTFSEEGGTYIGQNRFKTDMVSVEGLEKEPCCNRPTLYPIVWCDDCGYEAWDKARNAKGKAA